MYCINKDTEIISLPYVVEDDRGVHTVTSLEVLQYLWPDQAWVAYTTPDVTVVLSDVQVNEIQARNREAAYRDEADVLYLEEVEAAIKENRSPNFSAWLAKKDEIRARYPYAVDTDNDGVVEQEDNPTVWDKIKSFFQ